MNRIIRLACAAVVAVGVVVAFSTSARAAGDGASAIAGHWVGSIKLPGQELPIDIDFSADPAAGGAMLGDISIPLQGVKDLALTEIALADGKYSFKFPAAPGGAIFSATLAADGSALTGEIAQAGMKFPFEVKRAKAPADNAAEALADFDAVVEKVLKDWKVPGVGVAIVKDGVIVSSKGIGFRDVEKQLPVTGKTLFAIGSSSKAFTTFVLGQLADEGKLDLDKPIIEKLSDFKLHDETATKLMTPKDLVTHRSGLPRHDAMWYNGCHTREQMFQRLRYLEPNATFRETWQYNNLMYLTAGYLIERITGKPWEDNVRERIFAPLGMSRSNFSVSESQLDADHALPYADRDDVVKPIAFRDIANIGPAGSINSCADDMANWVVIQLSNGLFRGKQIIEKTTAEMLHTPQMTMGGGAPENEIVPVGYAMGWFVDVYRGHRRIHHGGNIDGFSTQVAFYPEDQLGIVVMANMNGTPVPNIITNLAADRIIGLEHKDWSADLLTKSNATKAAAKEAGEKKAETRLSDAPPSQPLGNYAGEYEHPGYGIIKVEAADERLSITFNNITSPFEHWHYDVFNGQETDSEVIAKDMKVQFLMNVRGEIDRLEAPLEPSVKPIVFTRRPDAKLADPAYLERFVGAYELPTGVISISKRDTILIMTVPGQPPYDLVPLRNDTFKLKIVDGFIVRFIMNADGSVKELHSDQPNGLFIATRK